MSAKRTHPPSLASIATSLQRMHQHFFNADSKLSISGVPFPPAIDWPLGLCDYRGVNPKADTFPVALIYPDREGETLSVKYNPNQKWKYLHGMTPEEAVLIKCFDSIQDGSVAVFTPHTGFEDPTTPEGTPPRESIELRALVFYD